jgi:hypothetical protein
MYFCTACLLLEKGREPSAHSTQALNTSDTAAKHVHAPESRRMREVIVSAQNREPSLVGRTQKGPLPGGSPPLTRHNGPLFFCCRQGTQESRVTMRIILSFPAVQQPYVLYLQPWEPTKSHPRVLSLPCKQMDHCPSPRGFKTL